MLTAAGYVLYLDAEDSPRFLLLRNRLHGTWGFPKGHLEDGETPREGARRELLEETGIAEIEVHAEFEEIIRYRVPAGARGEGSESYEKSVHFFLARVSSPDFVLSEEHEEGRWMSAQEVLDHLQYEDLRVVFRAANAALPTRP